MTEVTETPPGCSLSIVTVHLNQFGGLRATKASLEHLLSEPFVEWVLVDGASSPETADQRETLKAALAQATVGISEADEGIYHAMNKGTAAARGDYLLYLNAGDELHPGFRPDDLFRDLGDRSPAMIWGACIERYRGGQTIAVKTRSPRWAWYGMPALHPAILFNRRALGDSPYDTSYRIAADYELVCRLLQAGDPVVMPGHTLAIYHHGGLSDTLGHLTRQEENRVRLKHFNVAPAAGRAIVAFKRLNKLLSRIHWFRRLWRSRV